MSLPPHVSAVVMFRWGLALGVGGQLVTWLLALNPGIFLLSGAPGQQFLFAALTLLTSVTQLVSLAGAGLFAGAFVVRALQPVARAEATESHDADLG